MKIPYILVLIILSLAATSCVKDVILDAMEEPTVVVECILSDEAVQTLHLVYTKGASREAAPDLPEATAVLTDLTEGKEAGRFARTAEGSWTLAYAAIPEHRYRLDVTVPGHEPIWAEQTMPEPPGIVVNWRKWSRLNDSHAGYEFRFTHLHDPIWFFGVDYPSRDSQGETTRYLCTNAPGVDLNNIAGENMKYCDDELFSREYLWEQSSSPGIRTTFYRDLDGMPLHNGYLRFPVSDTPSDSTFTVAGYFQGYISNIQNFVHAEMRPAELHYCSVSEEYDCFLKDFFHMKQTKESTDLADIFLRENLYSNVQGALGVFGAKIEHQLEWEGKDSWRANGFFLLASFVSDYIESNPMNAYVHYIPGGGVAGTRGILELHPSELLHYEYYLIPGEDGPLPDWSPERVGSVKERFYLKEIQNQEQLDVCGLGDCGEIDFTRKKVVLFAILGVNMVPFLVGFGHPFNNATIGYKWQEGVFAPIIFYADTTNSRNLEDVFCETPFRCALLVDKDEVVATCIDNSDRFCIPMLDLSPRFLQLARMLAVNR